MDDWTRKVRSRSAIFGLDVGLGIVPHPFIPPPYLLRFSASTYTSNLSGELTGKKKMEQSAGNW